jgi:hypothetical protein
MKKFFLVVLVVLLMLTLLACGKSLEERVTEKMLEEMAEQDGADADIDVDQNGDDVDMHIEQDGTSVDLDVDGDSGSMTISDGENDMVMEFNEDASWPGDKMPNHVPEPKGVTFVGTTFVDPVVSVFFEGCSDSIAAAYSAQLEASGWEIVSTLDVEGTHQVQATNADGEWLQFTWTDEDGSGGLTYSGAE